MVAYVVEGEGRVEKRQFHYHFHAWRGCKCECCYKVFRGKGGGGYRGGVEQFAVFIRFNGATTMSALCKCVRSSTLAQPEEDCRGRAGQEGWAYNNTLSVGEICFLFSVSL